LRDGLAPRTVGHVHRLLHRALGHAATWGVVQQNVASLVSPPRVASTEIEIIREDEIKAVLDKLRGRPLYMIATLALATGMRRGELLALRWQDVDLDAGKLRVQRSLEQTKAGGLQFKSPKTKHGRRTITIPSSIVAELRAHLKDQQERRLALGAGRPPADALVFPTWEFRHQKPECTDQGMGFRHERRGVASLAAAHPCLKPDRRRRRRLDDQPPPWARIAGDHTRGLWTPVLEHRRPGS
jgi:integrase